MSGPAIPREARLKLHALRDCKVIRADQDCPGFGWVSKRGYVAWTWAVDRDGVIDFRLSIEGRALADLVVKPILPRARWEAPAW